jgi:predicted metal-dependent RNase
MLRQCVALGVILLLIPNTAGVSLAQSTPPTDSKQVEKVKTVVQNRFNNADRNVRNVSVKLHDGSTLKGAIASVGDESFGL